MNLTGVFTGYDESQIGNGDLTPAFVYIAAMVVASIIATFIGLALQRKNERTNK